MHPGYGFLAENAAFAQRCKDEGIVFIGPSPEVIDQMGDKVKARQIMKAAGVPVVPGSDGILTSEEEVLKTMEVDRLSLHAQGGGRRRRQGVAAGALARAKFLPPIARWARRRHHPSAMPRLYVEKFIEKPRHVEIQILADKYGRVIHLYDRECSIQRRHQKVIEESPAPG